MNAWNRTERHTGTWESRKGCWSLHQVQWKANLKDGSNVWLAWYDEQLLYGVGQQEHRLEGTSSGSNPFPHKYSTQDVTKSRHHWHTLLFPPLNYNHTQAGKLDVNSHLKYLRNHEICKQCNSSPCALKVAFRAGLSDGTWGLSLSPRT